MQSGYSAEPGQWRTARTPYLAGVMDSFADPAVEQITFVKSARVGGTETINNMLGYTIDQAPGPVLYIYPDENAAKEECKDRIAVFIANSPRLASHIPHVGWKTMTSLDVGSTRIYMAWATSPTTLIRRTIMVVFIDELDNCDQQAGRLGDTLLLASERVTTYKGRAKVVITSTPTISTAAAWVAYQTSDRRQYYVPCPKCGTYQVLKFDQIKVDDRERDPDSIVLNELAYYECTHCHEKLKDREHKRWMVERGVWIGKTQEPDEQLPLKRPSVVARAVFDHPDRWTPQLRGAPIVTRKVGFHIWSAYSPWRSWSQILAKWFEIKSQGEEEKRVFRNSWLGEPWEQIQTMTTTSRMRDKALTGYERFEIPEKARVLTAAVDIQEDRIYYAARAWGPYCESWLVDHGVKYKFDEDVDVFDALEDLRNLYYVDRPFFRGSKSFRPDIMLVDSGFRTQDVYKWCNRHANTAACKGESTTRPHLIRRAAMAPKQATSSETARDLWLINVDQAKDTLYAWANNRGNGPNTFHLHKDVDDEWIHQFTAEHKVVEKGKMVWKLKTIGRANHFLDVEAYMLGGAELAKGLEIKTPTTVRSHPARSEKQNPLLRTPVR